MTVKPVVGHVAKPKRKPPRPYFTRLDPGKDLEKQMASRMVQYLCAESDEDGRVIYMRMYHSLYGNRYRDRNGANLWAEAPKYLGRTIRRKNGLMWLNRTKLVPDLPPPFKPIPKFTPRKRKPRTAWYKDVALRAEENGSSISEQIAADRQGEGISRRTLRIQPLQQKRNADTGENEWPDPKGVDEDHVHA
jgi:hypothetical protein